MAETDNLKLALPGSNEYVDVEVLNENFRKIDTSVLLALAAAAPYSAAATYAVGAYCTKGGPGGSMERGSLGRNHHGSRAGGDLYDFG